MEWERVLGGAYEVLPGGAVPDDLPSEWRPLLRGRLEDVGDHIACALDLSDSSQARDLLVSAHEVVLVVPKARRRSKRRVPAQMALALCYDGILLFSAPDRGPCPFGRPEPYECLCRHIGVVQFGVHGGRLIAPSGLAPLSALHSPEEPPLDALPFYSYGNGDYDCWRDGDFAVTWVFNHEAGALVSPTSEDFAGWFERKLVGCLGLGPRE
jgi:hypothetical protein